GKLGDAHEALEDVFPLVFGYARTAVEDRDADAPVPSLDEDLDVGGRGVAERVADQGAQDLLDAFSVAADFQRRLGSKHDDGAGVLPPRPFDHPFDRLGDLHALDHEVGVARFQVSRRDQVFDQVRHRLRVLLDQPQHGLPALERHLVARLQEQGGRAPDHGERIAELVADHGDQLQLLRSHAGRGQGRWLVARHLTVSTFSRLVLPTWPTGTPATIATRSPRRTRPLRTAASDAFSNMSSVSCPWATWSGITPE